MASSSGAGKHCPRPGAGSAKHETAAMHHPYHIELIDKARTEGRLSHSREGPCVMSSATTRTRVVEYLKGGNQRGFGRHDPWTRFGGGGGNVEAVAKAVTVDDTLTEGDCPDDDTPFSAMLFGKMVGSAKLSEADMNIVKMFMEIAYEDTVSFYT